MAVVQQRTGQQVYSRKSAAPFNTAPVSARYSHECQRITRDRDGMEGREMTKHCGTKASGALADDQVAAVAAGGGAEA